MQTTRIDFYILNTNKIDMHLNFICRLIEKVYLQNHRLYVFCENQRLAETIDEWLWVFDAASFIPHNLLGEGPNPPPPIQLGWTPPEKTHRDLLLNLSQQVPECITQFKRVMEVIYDHEETKQSGRTRFRTYQKQGHTIQSHQIDCNKTGVISESI